MKDAFFNELSDDDLIEEQFEIFCTDEGFMPFDHVADDYLYDADGNNCFDTYWDAVKLVDEAILKQGSKK